MSGAASGPLRTLILISGRGSNMLAIVHAARAGSLDAQILGVISDQPAAPGLRAAQELDIAAQVVAAQPGEPRAQYDQRLATHIRVHAPQVIVLAGFMRILSAPLVHEFAGQLLNIHPSLLPKHRGLHTHRRVLEAGEREHGCSVHFVTEELDGGPVVLQARVPVLADDTVESLSARVQTQEHRIYPMTLSWMASGRLRWQDGIVWLDDRRLEQPVMLES